MAGFYIDLPKIRSAVPTCRDEHGFLGKRSKTLTVAAGYCRTRK